MDCDEATALERSCPVAGRDDKPSAPHVYSGSDSDLNLRFYEGYDENFLFNKGMTLTYVLDQGDTAKALVEDNLVSRRGGLPLSEKYFEEMRAELLFTALHQFEGFFAVLMAVFQPLPHWVYLTAYGPGDVEAFARLFTNHRIGELTGEVVHTQHEFVQAAVYSDTTPSDLELAARWEENLANASWLIGVMADFYLEYLDAYNAYKHGLRLITGYNYFGVTPQNEDGTPQGPLRILHASDDSVHYFTKEKKRDSDDGKEFPIADVTQHFNPEEAFFYLAKMQQMLATMKGTRLYWLRGGAGEVGQLNTFFQLDKDAAVGLRRRWRASFRPMSDEDKRRYGPFLDERGSAQPADDIPPDPDAPQDEGVDELSKDDLGDDGADE
jgi:hypothetical protein